MSIIGLDLLLPTNGTVTEDGNANASLLSGTKSPDCCALEPMSRWRSI
jgi:hypothetical protein